MRMTYLAAIAALAFALPATAAESKVGVVNFQEAVNSVDEGKVATAQLSKEAEAKQTQMKNREDELRKLQDEFQKQQTVWSEETRNQKGEEILRKRQEYQEAAMKARADLQERERDLTRPIFDKMTAIVREIATAYDYTVVIDAQAAIFAVPTVDLTAELVSKYNARHKPSPEALKSAAEVKKPAAAAPAASKPAADAKKPAAKKK